MREFMNLKMEETKLFCTQHGIIHYIAASDMIYFQ